MGVSHISSNETEGPGTLARKIAESVVRRLMDKFTVPGKHIEDSFSFLLEAIDKAEPRTDILAKRLHLSQTFSSRLDALREAWVRGIISPRNVETLEKNLETDTGLHYVRSHTRKWLDEWTEEGSGASEASRRQRRKPTPTSDSRAVNGWLPNFSTVPETQSFAIETLPSVERLLKAVLNDSSEGTVGAIGAHGIGGVGKTTACIIVANDTEVRNKFHDGVFWIGLGMDSTADEVRTRIVKILRKSGGSDYAKKVESMESKKIDDAVEEASEWISVRKILLVVDNVWSRKVGERAANWIRVLRPLVGVGGCLLFSTRIYSLVVREDATPVEFDTLKDAEPAEIGRAHV